MGFSAFTGAKPKITEAVGTYETPLEQNWGPFEFTLFECRETD
jgi:hypothetical protein